MSEDEGEGDDDDDDDDNDDQEDELEGGDSEGVEGDVSNDLNLSVTGVSLKPQSPLLGDDEEVENELIKVCLLCNSVVLLASFAFFQSLDCQQNFTKIKLFSKQLSVWCQGDVLLYPKINMTTFCMWRDASFADNKGSIL